MSSRVLSLTFKIFLIHILLSSLTWWLGVITHKWWWFSNICILFSEQKAGIPVAYWTHLPRSQISKSMCPNRMPTGPNPDLHLLPCPKATWITLPSSCIFKCFPQSFNQIATIPNIIPSLFQLFQVLNVYTDISNKLWPVLQVSFLVFLGRVIFLCCLSYQTVEQLCTAYALRFSL